MEQPSALDGQLRLGKLVLFDVILILAAANRFRLTSAFEPTIVEVSLLHYAAVWLGKQGRNDHRRYGCMDAHTFAANVELNRFLRLNVMALVAAFPYYRHCLRAVRAHNLVIQFRSSA